MVFFAERTAGEPAKFSKLHTTNRAQLVVNTPTALLRVDNAEVRLAVYPHLHERHGIAAILLQVGQELWNVNSRSVHASDLLYLFPPCSAPPLFFASFFMPASHHSESSNGPHHIGCAVKHILSFFWRDRLNAESLLEKVC